MAAPLTLSCSLSSTAVPVTGDRRMVYLLLETGGGEGSHTLPLNLALVLDCSDSMRIRLVTNEQFARLAHNGQMQEIMKDGVPAYQVQGISPEELQAFPSRMDYVARALSLVAEFLRPADHYSVTTFASQAYLLVSARSGADRARLVQAGRELNFLHLGDETRLAEGMALALEQLQRTKDRACSCRMIILTDGHTLNVSECYAMAERAHQGGVLLTTMGIGTEFNEDLLIPLADLTGGKAYYIETPDQVLDAFRTELGAAMRVSYHNLEIKLLLPAGVQLNRVHRVLPELGAFDPGPSQQGSYSLALGDYDPATPLALLLEIIIPPWKAGEYRLAQALLAWDDPSGSAARPNQRQDIPIRMVEGLTVPLNGRVMNFVEKVGAFKMGTSALQAALGGDPGAATLRLRQAATRLLDMGEEDLASAMLSQAQVLEQGGVADPNLTKRLRYETRRLTSSVGQP